MVGTEHPTAALQAVLAQGAGRLGLAHPDQGIGQGGGRPQGDRVVGAEHPAAPLQGVLAQDVGRLDLARLHHVEGEPACGGQGVGVVGAEDLAPTVEQLCADGPAAGAVSSCLQVADGVQDQVPTVGGVVSERGGGEHVRSELGVGGPAGRVLGVAGAGSSQNCHGPLGSCLLPVGR
ncbi:MAG TPA: hypothetical protein VER39_14475 [Nocardioidaceae bacterium]|nr:hypothetical protein [Nocardioidaceae bacterium]